LTKKNSNKRERSEEEEEEEEDEEDSESASLDDDDDDDDDLVIDADDGGAQAYRVIKSVDDWHVYLRTPYARRTFWDALQVVINNREHGKIKEWFESMLENINDVRFYDNFQSGYGKCGLCGKKRHVSQCMTYSEYEWHVGSNCGTLMSAIYDLMHGIWEGDSTSAIRENMDKVIEANKEYK